MCVCVWCVCGVCVWCVCVCGVCIYVFSSEIWITVFTGVSLLKIKVILKGMLRASLVVQWLRVWLPRQEKQAWSLLWEGPTCPGAVKHCAPEPGNQIYWAHASQLMKPESLALVLCNKRSPCIEKPAHHNQTDSSPCPLQPEKSSRSNEDPAQPQIIKKIFFKKVEKSPCHPICPT